MCNHMNRKQFTQYQVFNLVNSHLITAETRNQNQRFKKKRQNKQRKKNKQTQEHKKRCTFYRKGNYLISLVIEKLAVIWSLSHRVRLYFIHECPGIRREKPDVVLWHVFAGETDYCLQFLLTITSVTNVSHTVLLLIRHLWQNSKLQENMGVRKYDLMKQNRINYIQNTNQQLSWQRTNTKMLIVIYTCSYVQMRKEVYISYPQSQTLHLSKFKACYSFFLLP